MKIKVRDIPRDGLEFEKHLAPGEIGLENDAAYKCVSPLSIAARLERHDDVIAAEVRVEGTYEFNCGRCLEPIVKKNVDRLQIFFDYFPGLEYIDLGEDIRQEMVILLNGITLCRENCKGLCPDCGVNLNKEKCKCK